MPTPVETPLRTIAYIDGFNLYFGLRDSGWQRYYWLDVEALAKNLLPSGAHLATVKYFTSRVSAPPDKRKRQSDYLEALQHATKTELIFGRYEHVSHFCQNCFHEQFVPNEKMTDVNIAVEIMRDSFMDHFDLALLISGDSDLCPPVDAVRLQFLRKRVVVAFPPRRHSRDLEIVSSSHFVIGRARFRDSQLPDQVVKPDGHVLRRPESWK